MHYVPLWGSRRPIRGSHPLSKGFLYGFSSIEKHCSYIFILWFAALRRVSGGTYAGNLPSFKICVWRSLSDAFSLSVTKSMDLRIKKNGTAAISRLCRSFVLGFIRGTGLRRCSGCPPALPGSTRPMRFPACPRTVPVRRRKQTGLRR